MTVRANKPAFNVREKLKELDYDRVPYEKMPAGAVVQSSLYRMTGRYNINSSSYATIFSHTMTPKFASSRLIHQFWSKTNINNTSLNAGQDYRITRTDIGDATALIQASWQNYFNRSDFTSDYYPPVDFTFVDEAQTIETITYNFRGRKYAGTQASWYIGDTNYSNGYTDTLRGNYGWWLITEIRQ